MSAIESSSSETPMATISDLGPPSGQTEPISDGHSSPSVLSPNTFNRMTNEWEQGRISVRDTFEKAKNVESISLCK